jgi:hypothetical protein
VDKGIILNPKHHSFKVYADADFGGLWDKQTAQDNPATAKSRTGYVVTYADCPIIWASTLQTKIALSTTETEYIALSTALWQAIPIMRLVKEIRKELGLPMETVPTVQCKLFEDNAGAIELANVPKMRPRTRHFNTKYHHFRKYISNGMIKVVHIRTEDQLADIMTKNVATDLFIKFRKGIMGW